MAKGKIDYETIRKHCQAVANKLFADFDRRRQTLKKCADEFYPLGRSGLVKSIDEVADADPYSEEAKLYTIQPIEALRDGAGGFHANLTSPSRRWFRFRDATQKVVQEDSQTHEGNKTLDSLTAATEDVFGASNAYAMIYKVYEHLLAFGFACMLVTKDDERVINCTTLRVGTYALGVGKDNRIDRVVRRFAYTAEQLVLEFGQDALPQFVLDCLENHTKRFEVNCLIEPHYTGIDGEWDKTSKALAGHLDDEMVYRAIYWLPTSNGNSKHNGVLKIKGFRIKPIVAPRFNTEDGDTYGRGRGIDALDCARGLQTFEYDLLKISGDNADGAVVADAQFKEEGLKMGRKAINYARFGESRQSLVMPVRPQPPDMRGTQLCAEKKESEINRAFFVSAFATIDALKNQTGVKTATEIDALVRENMEKLGSVVTNLDKEFLDPLVSIVSQYAIAAKMPPLTDEDITRISGTLQVEYVSAIHLSLKATTIAALSQLSQFAIALEQVKIQSLDKVFDNIDSDRLIRLYGQLVGVPESVFTNPAVMKDSRNAAKEQAQQMQQAQQLQGTAGVMKQIGEIPTDNLHIGGQLAKAMRGM